MKFLIIRLGSLGDVVLATSVIETLKISFPDAEIDFLVKKEYQDILSDNPELRKIIPFDNRGSDRGIKGIINVSIKLRKSGYTYVVDLHGNLRSRMISLLIPGAKTLRYDKQAIRRRLLLLGFNIKTRHVVDTYFGAILEIVARERPERPRIYLSAKQVEAAKGFIENSLGRRVDTLIGISPGAKLPTKMWPRESFIEVGRRLVREYGAGVLVAGSPDEMELCEGIAADIGKGAISTAGRLSLKETSAAISLCNVLISNDSGLMHIAGSVGTPVAAIFGPTVTRFGFSPIGNGTVIERELSCRPCSLHGGEKCPKGHFECIKGIGNDIVLNKVAQILNTKIG